MRTELAQKYANLQMLLKPFGKVAVAFSGGVDSALLLHAAHTTLPGQVMALTACSCVFPHSEQRSVRETVQQWGIPQKEIAVDFLSIPNVAENPSDRCYWCKRELLGAFCRVAKEAGINTVLEGSNVDDLGDYRPGLSALRESSVKSPLCDAGMTKADIRELSRELGLPAWDKPSMACLASRIPYGEPVTPDKLRMVEQAEEILLQMGFGQIRVRHHGKVARIECAPEDFAGFLDAQTRKELSQRFQEIGFPYTSLDLQGYRTGSLNETIWAKEEPR